MLPNWLVRISLGQAMGDPWVEATLQQSIRIYEVAYRAGQGSMPQNIIGRRVAVGTMPLSDLYRLVADEFGLRMPAQ